MRANPPRCHRIEAGDTHAPLHRQGGLIHARSHRRRGAIYRPRDVDHAVEPEWQAIIEGWRTRFVSDVAWRIGLCSDSSLAGIIDGYLDDLAARQNQVIAMDCLAWPARQ